MYLCGDHLPLVVARILPGYNSHAETKGFEVLAVSYATRKTASPLTQGKKYWVTLVWTRKKNINAAKSTS